MSVSHYLHECLTISALNIPEIKNAVKSQDTEFYSP